MGSILRLGLWLAQWPSATLAWRFSALIALCADKFGSEAARTTEVNLQLCFPELSAADRLRMRRTSLRHMAMLFFEFAQLAHWPQDKLLGQIIEFEGRELLDAAAARKESVLLLVPHFGNWELFCAYLGTQYGFGALYDPPKIASFEAVILNVRERFAGDMFAIDTTGIRGLLKTLRQGTPVAVLPDQVPDRSAGVYVPFFGHPALTMTLSHKLARKSQHIFIAALERVNGENLKMVEGSQQPTPRWGYRLRIESLRDHLPGSATAGVRSMDAEQFSNVLNAATESLVRSAPEQYQWEYKRFKRPPGKRNTNIYRRQ